MGLVNLKNNDDNTIILEPYRINSVIILIMKTLLLLISTIYYQQSIACSCRAIPILDSIAESDFIATAKILDVIPEQQKRWLADIDIEVISLYKGEKVDKLKIRHSSESSCGLDPPIDSTWLIFANKDKEGDLKFSLCSQSRQIDKEFEPYIERKYVDYSKKLMETKLEILKYLDKKRIYLSNEYKLRTAFTKQCLKDFNGIEVKANKFALYKVSLDAQFNVNNIDPLIEFTDERLKENLLNCVYGSVKIFSKDNQTEIPAITNIIVGLIYHPPIDGDESFIDEYIY